EQSVQLPADVEDDGGAERVAQEARPAAEEQLLERGPADHTGRGYDGRGGRRRARNSRSAVAHATACVWASACRAPGKMRISERGMRAWGWGGRGRGMKGRGGE